MSRSGPIDPFIDGQPIKSIVNMEGVDVQQLLKLITDARMGRIPMTDIPPVAITSSLMECVVCGRTTVAFDTRVCCPVHVIGCRRQLIARPEQFAVDVARSPHTYRP